MEDFELDFVAGGEDPAEEEEIVITGKKPNTVTVTGGDGSTWSYQFYSDGVALVRHNDGQWVSWDYTVNSSSSSSVGTGNPPSLIIETTDTYRFTAPTATDPGTGTGSGPRTLPMPE